jgi:hypothetical protein
MHDDEIALSSVLLATRQRADKRVCLAFGRVPNVSMSIEEFQKSLGASGRRPPWFIEN